MAYCGEHTLVKDQGSTVEAVSLRCRAWTCPECAELRKRQLTAQGIAGQPDTFLTLTSRRTPGADADQAAAALSHAWRIIRLRALREARRDTERRPEPSGTPPVQGWPRDGRGRVPRQVILRGDKLPFLAVVESTKLGWPHLHVLARSSWISQMWLSAQADDVLGSPVVDIRRIKKKAQTVAYCAKYCTKCEHKFGTTKRYWQSRDYQLANDNRPPKEKDPVGTWTIDAVDIGHVARTLDNLGFLIEWHAHHHLTATQKTRARDGPA